MSRVLLDVGMKAGVGSPGIARAAVLDCGLPPARNSQDLALMVSEVVTNAVRHGTGPGGQLLLRVQVDDDVVHVALDEPGVKGWASGTAAPRAQSRTRRSSKGQVGGWGLQLVNDLADRWGIDQEPYRSVWFELTLLPASPVEIS